MDSLLDFLKNIWLGSLYSAIIGGLIAGTASFLATRRAHRNNLQRQEIAHKLRVNNLLQALYDEINILWEGYWWGAGEALEKLNDREAIKWIYPLTPDIFTIYNGNAALIGSIDDKYLRKCIIITYTKARALIDAFRLNNKLIIRYDELKLKYILGAGASVQAKKEVEVMEMIMMDYAGKIIKMHFDIKKDIIDLKDKFNKKGFS